MNPEEFGERMAERIERAMKLISTRKKPRPNLKKLKKPLPPGVITRVFCSKCGRIYDLKLSKVFILLTFEGLEEEMEKTLDKKMDWKNKYFKTNSCPQCQGLLKKVEIETF